MINIFLFSVILVSCIFFYYLYREKVVLFVVVRGLYKDLIKFSNSDELLNEEELRIKVNILLNENKRNEFI